MAMFQRAEKRRAKLRLALFGPAGAGKTFTALSIAQGIGGSIAVIDTEYGSSEKYGDRFSFDIAHSSNPCIDEIVDIIQQAKDYDVLIIDSLSHAWQELLEDVNRIAKARYGGNTWAAWSDGTPKQKKLVRSMLSYPGHLAATMRSKTEWTIGEGKNGRSAPQRVGLAPEQGKGIEYEFDMLMELSPDHTVNVIKDRTGKFQDRIIEQPGAEFGQEIVQWLNEGAAPRVTARDIADEIGAIMADWMDEEKQPFRTMAENAGSSVEQWLTVLEAVKKHNSDRPEDADLF